MSLARWALRTGAIIVGADPWKRPLETESRLEVQLDLTSKTLNDPMHWRDWAEEVRVLAEEMPSQDAAIDDGDCRELRTPRGQSRVAVAHGKPSRTDWTIEAADAGAAVETGAAEMPHHQIA
jgi:hypothetical protein